MAILVPNRDLGLLEPSGNQFGCEMAILVPNKDLRLWGVFWQLQFGCKIAILAPNRDLALLGLWQLLFGCEMAILAPNLALGLLEPSGNYNLAVKWQFGLQIWTWPFWSLLAITIWL